MAHLPSLADAPGTLREYETIYILRPDTQNDKVADLNQRVRGIIESMGGMVLNVDNWGKRKLAYEVKKELKGIYLYWQYLGSADVVTEFERNMRMLDPVIRYMTIVTASNIDPKSKESQVTDETYTKAANTAADEEEMMLRRTEEAAALADEPSAAVEGAAAAGDEVAKAAPADDQPAGDEAAPAAEATPAAPAADDDERP